MKISLAWGTETIAVELPDEWQPFFLLPAAKKKRSCLDGALLSPLESPPLREVASGVGSAVVVVPDWTRSRLTFQILPRMIRELEEGGLDKRRIRVLIATGAHPGSGVAEEFVRKLGEVSGGTEIDVHDAVTSNFVSLGKTTRGTEVLVNSLLFEGDLLVTLSFVQPHYFAGFTGGGKSIVPGLSSMETIRENHSLSLLRRNEDGTPSPWRRGVLKRNPVAEDIREASSLARIAFSLNAVVGPNEELIDCFGGDWTGSHEAACRASVSNLVAKADIEADIVIASVGGAPFDFNLVQAHKALLNAKDFAARGGAIVLLARCPNGFGSRTFKEWLSFSTLCGLWRKAEAHYEMSAQTAISAKEICRSYKVILVTEISPDVLGSLGITAFRDPVSAVERLCREMPGRQRVAILPFAFHTFSPRVVCSI